MNHRRQGAGPRCFKASRSAEESLLSLIKFIVDGKQRVTAIPKRKFCSVATGDQVHAGVPARLRLEFDWKLDASVFVTWRRTGILNSQH